MFQHWFPSPNFPPYTFGWKTEGIYISSLSPSCTWVASVNTLSRSLWPLQSRGQSRPTSSTRLGWLPSGDQGQSVRHPDQWGEERTTLRGQKLCAIFCLLPCLLVYLWNLCLLYNRKIYSHLTPEFVFLAPYSTVNYSSLKWQETGGKFSPYAQTPPPQTDFKPEAG